MLAILPVVMSRSVLFQYWVAGALVPIALIIIGRHSAMDFTHFWIAGQKALSGQTAEIYTTAKGAASNFPYPPVGLPWFLPFAALPLAAAGALWNVASAAFFYFAARPWLPRGFPPALTILTPAALICLNFGQTGLLLGGLWLLAFRGKWWAVPLLMFKPHLGVLSMLSFKSRPGFFKACALAIVLLSMSVALFGLSSWQEFFDRSQSQANMLWRGVMWQGAGTTPAIAYGFWGWIPFAVAGAWLLLRKIDAFTAATASFLISPYGFHYDMVVVSLGFGLMAYQHWDDLSVSDRIAVTAGFMSPVLAVCGSWLVPPLLLWGLWIQTSVDETGN